MSYYNAEVKQYISAKWNVEVCREENDGTITSRFPCGHEMKKNMVLDSFLEIIPLHVASTGMKWRFQPTELASGRMEIGTGQAALNYTGRALDKFVKFTSYVRPNQPSGGYIIDNSGIGMRTFGRVYEFTPESSPITYHEAGFRSVRSSSWGGVSGDPLLTRFLLTGSGFTGINVGVGEYIKVQYELSFQMPALVNPIPVTGTGLVYGSFNGSGQLMLQGLWSEIFGSVNSDGRAVYSNTRLNPTLVADGYEGAMWSLASDRINSSTTRSSIRLSANLVPTGIDFNAINSSGGIPRININNISQTSTNPPWPDSAFGTAYDVYALRNRFIDYKLIFPAEYPSGDQQIGGFFISPASLRFDGAFYYPPNTGYGWYWKFDAPQTKYKDQLIEINFRFSADRG